MSTSCWNCWMSDLCFISMYNFMSSAYINTLRRFNTRVTSSTNKMKSKGPKREPCGTPDVTFTGTETCPLNLTVCVLFVK